jgi:hypothetical protein
MCPRFDQDACQMQVKVVTSCDDFLGGGGDNIKSYNKVIGLERMDWMQDAQNRGPAAWFCENPCGGGVEYLHRDPASRKRRRNGAKKGRAIA